MFSKKNFVRKVPIAQKALFNQLGIVPKTGAPPTTHGKDTGITGLACIYKVILEIEKVHRQILLYFTLTKGTPYQKLYSTMEYLYRYFKHL